MNNMKKLLFKSLILIFAASSVMTSCVGLDEVWDRIDTIEAKLDSIQNDLNAQVDALSSLLSDGSTIASCTKNADGSYVVKLSNGTEFTVLPAGTDVSALIAYKTVGGERYWATYNAAGELEILKDASGNGITVENTVNVEVTDGKYYLVINGKKYQTGFDTEDVVQVFSSCETHTDASGQVYAMTFTFGDGQKVTVTVDGYKGVIFKLSNVGATAAVTEYYVGYGETMTFLMDVEDVIDYVMQIPDGWRVNEYVEELTGETYVDITAPVEAVVDAGAAVSKGDLKVVSVVEGGKAAVTKLSLSTDPFKVYNVTSVKAVIEPHTGIEKFVYGLTDIATFDEAQITAQVNQLLKSSGELPDGFYISEKAIDKTLAEIYGSEIPEGANLMFWAVPALYTEGDDVEIGGYYVKEDMLRTLMLAPVFVKMEVSDVTVLDANLKVSVRGVDRMFAGTMPKSDSALEEILYLINNDIIEPVTYGLTYDGPASAFPSEAETVSMDPGTSYISWLVPVDEDKTTYTSADVISKEFSTLPVKAGGSLALTIGEFTKGSSNLSAPVSSEGAAMIYYAWLNDNDGSRLLEADNESKMSVLLSAESFTVVKSSSGVAELDFIKPETTMWLFAVAVGQDGKYGEVVCKSATTKAVTFNNLSVSVTETSVTAKDAVFNVTVAGGEATDYIYWCGKQTDPFWLYEEFCNKSIEGAEVYMAANPDADAIQSVMRKNGNVAADGTLTITDLEVNTTYALVVLAKDADGKFSRGTLKQFNTPAADLGNMVTSNDEDWKSVKQWIESNIEWHKNAFQGGGANGQGYASYAFGIKIPTEYKAYITCFGTQATEIIEQILEIEELCTDYLDVSKPIYDENGNEIDVYKPSWIDDSGREITWGLFDYALRYLHGDPESGCVTYFPTAGHNQSSCIHWEGNECSNYTQYIEWLSPRLTLDYWREYVRYNGNYAHEGDPNNQYSRNLTDEDYITEIAQEYLDQFTKYYKDAEPVIFVNDGSALEMKNRSAVGLDDSGNVIDKVTVVLVDSNNNYFEPMVFDVPNYFR